MKASGANVTVVSRIKGAERKGYQKLLTPKQNAFVKRSKEISAKLFFYLVIGSLSFVFVYPLLYLVSQSMMQFTDVADSTVRWIPKQLDFSNYTFAYGILGNDKGWVSQIFKNANYWNGFMNSVIIAFGSAALQILSCALVGYGFARYRFPGYTLWLSLVLFTFLVPPQTIVVPLFRFFSDLGWINTHLPFIVPSAMGHGLKGALFVLIFIQFFRRLPNVLEEAARIDGAGAFRTYWTIMLPLARPAMLVVFLFSVVWHWNDTFEPNLYLVVPDFYNLSQNLAIFNGQGARELSQATQSLSPDQAIGLAPTITNRVMAAAMLTILPMLILYLFTQRYFVESVERTGIAGE
jgi:multiple sugar transport system permease protein